MSQLIQTKDSSVSRVFFALWPEMSVRQTLYALAKECQSKCNARLMHADTLHMTLQFVGGVAHARLPQLIQAADRVLVPPFELTLERLSFWAHNHIVYAAPNAKVPALGQLVIALQQELIAEGFLFAGGKFNPHVTLLRHVEHAMEPQNITPIIWWADAFVLVESVVTNQRAHYRVLQKWLLLPRATRKL